MSPERRPKRVVKAVGSPPIELSQLSPWARVPRRTSHDNQRLTETPAPGDALIEQEARTFRNTIEQKFSSLEFGSPAALAMDDFAAKLFATAYSTSLASESDPSGQVSAIEVLSASENASNEAAIAETIRTRRQTDLRYRSAFNYIEKEAEASVERMKEISLSDAPEDMTIETAEVYAQIMVAGELKKIVEGIVDSKNEDSEITVVPLSDDFVIGPIEKISD